MKLSITKRLEILLSVYLLLRCKNFSPKNLPPICNGFHNFAICISTHKVCEHVNYMYIPNFYWDIEKHEMQVHIFMYIFLCNFISAVIA